MKEMKGKQVWARRVHCLSVRNCVGVRVKRGAKRLTGKLKPLVEGIEIELGKLSLSFDK